MLNYEAWREYKNSEIKSRLKTERRQKLDEEDPIIPEYGIRQSELEKDPDLWEKYYTRF